MLKMILHFIKLLVIVLRLIYLSIKTLPRDVKGFLIRTKLEKTVQKMEDEGSTVAKQFRKIVNKHPNKAAIIFEKIIWTFQDVKLINIIII